LISGGRGPDQRHHSLRDVIGWSLELLGDDERLLFGRLGVFVGGFDLDAVAALNPEQGVGAAADLVGRLVDRSLVVRRRVGATTRWSLLETVRTVAVHELAASGEDIGPRYVRWAADTAARMETRIGRLPHAEFDAVADDLRHALTQAAPDGTAYRLAESLAHLSFGHGLVIAARAHYRTAAELAPDPIAAAEDLGTAASVALTISDGETGFRLLLQAAARAAAAGARTAQAVAVASAVLAATRFSMSFTDPVPRDRVVALLAAAAVLADPADQRSAAVLAMARAWVSGRTPLDPDLELSRAAVAAARRSGDVALVLGALDALGTALANAGRLRQAHRLSDERLRLGATASRYEPAVAVELVDLFHVASTSALAAGDLPAAASIAERASRDDSVGTHPAITAPRLIRLHGLTGRTGPGRCAVGRLVVCHDGRGGVGTLFATGGLAVLGRGDRGTGARPARRRPAVRGVAFARQAHSARRRRGRFSRPGGRRRVHRCPGRRAHRPVRRRTWAGRRRTHVVPGEVVAGVCPRGRGGVGGGRGLT
jgi:hypothetical protein